MTSGVDARLHRDEDATNHHYESAEQALTYVAFTEKEFCPQDGQYSTELEECCYIAYQTEGNGAQASERSPADKNQRALS